MSVYVDELQNWWGKFGRGCHLVAETEEELHEFAHKIGLKREWFRPKSWPHYDLTEGMRIKAVAMGAEKLTRKEFVAFLTRKRLEKLKKRQHENPCGRYYDPLFYLWQ